MKLPYPRAILVGAGLLLSACNQAPSQAPQTPPPPEVTVTVVHARSVPVSHELVGRLAPTRVAQVRARVAGIILKRVYTEGTDVRQGDVLYQIDPAPLKVALHAREAALAKAEADATNAAATAKRYREIAAQKLLAKQDLDTALANERSTAAAVKQAQADVESARLDLGYATVAAPIAGRAGRAMVTEGALVGQGEATQLTTIEQIDPIYVNFSQSATELPELKNRSTGDDPAQVNVQLPDGSPYPQHGKLDFSDLAVDPLTGAVSLRAVLPNPDHALLPGMFVKLQLTTAVVDNAFVLPQAALSRDEQGAYVLIVDAGDKVVQRRVRIEGMTHSQWIVTGDLKDGDRMITEGLQRVQPGGSARAVAANAPPDGTSGNP